MGVVEFPNGMENKGALSMGDQVMIAGKDGGAPTLATIQQFKNLLVAIATGQVVPQIAKPGDVLGTPEDAAVFYAGPGTYVLPNGNVTLTANHNMFVWDNVDWDYIEIPVNVDLSEYLKKTDISTQSEVSNNLSSIDSSISVGEFSAVNDTPAKETGVLGIISGSFTSAGVAKIAILDKRTLISNNNFKFKVVSIHTIQIPGSSTQTFDVSSLMIPIEKGQYVGFQKSSLAVPRYGGDPDKGYGWYRVDSDIKDDSTLVYQTTPGFKFNFTVKVFRYVPSQFGITKTQAGLLLDEKANISDVAKLAGNVLGKNRFDKDSVNNLDGKYPSPVDGSLVPNSLYKTSDFLEFNPGETITQNKGISTVFYNAEKTFISSIASPKTYTFPNGATYLRTGVLKTELDTLQIEVSPIPTTYEAYGFVNEKQILRKENFKGVDLKNILGFVPSENLFKESEAIDNRFISAVDGTLQVNAGYKASGFIPFPPNAKGIQNYFLSTVFYDSSSKFISKADSGKWTSPANTAYVRTSVIKTALPTFMLVLGWELPGSYIPSTAVTFPDIRVKSDQIITKATEKQAIVDAAGGGDFTTISAAIAAINNGTSSSRATIIVRNGDYNETFYTKDYVDIIGEERDKVKLSYTGPNPANSVQYSTIFATSISKIKNMTIYTKDSKYPIHSDAGGPNTPYLVELENLICKHLGSTDGSLTVGSALGIGLYQNQHIKAINCDFIGYNEPYNLGGASVFIHDQAVASGLGHRSLTLENCGMYNAAYGIRVDLNNTAANNMSNDIILINNNINALVSDIFLSGTEAGWTWKIKALGNNIRRVINSGGNSYIVEEPGFTKSMRNRTGATILKNTVVIMDANNYGCVTNTSVANKNDVIGVTMEDIPVNGNGRVQISGWAKAKVNGAVPISVGDFIGTHASLGISQKSTGNKYAVARGAYAVSDSNGLIEIILTDTVY